MTTKNSIKADNENFLNQHFYFGNVWASQKKEQRDKIFDFVSFVFLVLYPL